MSREKQKSPLSGRLNLRPEDAAEYLGVGLSTFNEWVARFGCEKVSASARLVLYERAEVEALWGRVKRGIKSAS